MCREDINIEEELNKLKKLRKFLAIAYMFLLFICSTTLGILMYQLILQLKQ